MYKHSTDDMDRHKNKVREANIPLCGRRIPCYGVATISRLLKMIGLSCKRAL